MESSQIKFLRLHSDDDMIVALQPLKKGEKFIIDSKEIILQDDIPAKHKFSLGSYYTGDLLKMYGVIVGKANKDISPGNLISIDNLLHASEEYTGKTKAYHWKQSDNSKFIDRTFNGFVRKNGTVGTANYWLFIPTVL
jgi:altronate hydrolase